jgi:hypothetical protein
MGRGMGRGMHVEMETVRGIGAYPRDEEAARPAASSSSRWRLSLPLRRRARLRMDRGIWGYCVGLFFGAVGLVVLVGFLQR